MVALTDSVIERGAMEISLLKTLLSSIFRFGLLSSCNGMRQRLVQKSYQETDEILNLLRPILDAIFDSKMVLDEQLKHALGELDAIINEAAELVEGWHQMTSKVHFTLQMESLVSRAKTSGLEICKLLVMLLQFPTEALSSALVQSSCQNCIQKIQHATSAQTSDLIKEAIKDLEEDTTPSSEILVKIAESLSLVTNQELLQESVALEKLKAKVDCEKPAGEMEHIDHMLALVTHMRDSLMKLKQSEAINGMPIPADFRCPLSLEMMSDPVIVASGQTYERAFIKKWLDQGLMVCPKSCQTLSHTNLIPNYTVKALIANWCKSNNIKLPSPLKLENLNEPLGLHAHADSNFRDSRTLSHADHSFRTNGPMLSECIRPNGAHQNNRLASPLHPNAAMEAVVVNGLPSGTTLDVGNGLEADITRVSLSSSEERTAVSEEEWKVCPGGEASISSRTDFSKVSLVDERLSVHNRSSTVSSAVSRMDANEPSHLSSEVTCYGSNASGELMPETSPPVIPHREPELSPLFAEKRCRSQIWGRPPGRFVSRMVSSPALDTKVDLSVVETQVWKLIEDLQSSSVDVQTAAAAELRLLSKHSMDNRIVIANCGAISYLVGLLHSTDLKTQENAVTALLNLSINDNNKIAIANAGAIDPLIHVLETGNPEAKENSAATLFSLSVIDENKVKIGRSGAIRPLVELLGNGTPRGKKDAATALFNLSIFHENKTWIVEAGAVKYLVELMDPAAGMVDKAVAVLANLSTINEGRVAIGKEGGIPVLVGVVELGSARGKENAAAALLQLCTDSKKFCNLVLQEGAVPPLVALSQSGTPRAKEKARALLSFFRSQRRGNNGRS